VRGNARCCRARAALVEELGLEPGPELRALERAILVDDPALLAGGLPRARTVAPEQLPPDVADFTGREPVLADLRARLCADDPRAAPAIVALSGKLGVGKTALAIHAAHRLRHAFADGQLFVSLRGTEAELARDARRPAALRRRVPPPARRRRLPRPARPGHRRGRLSLERHRGGEGGAAARRAASNGSRSKMIRMWRILPSATVSHSAPGAPLTGTVSVS
jgi:hypothetical protein